MRGSRNRSKQFAVVVVCTLLSGQSVAEVIGNHGELTATKISESGCTSNANIRVERASGTIDTNSDDFLKLVGLARVALSFSCADLDTITVHVAGSDNTDNQWVMQKRSRWRLQPGTIASPEAPFAKETKKSALAPTLSKKVDLPTTDQIPYIKTLGYWGAKERSRGDSFILFEAYPTEQNAPRTNPNGYKYPGAPDYVMVHYVDHLSPIVELENVSAGAYRYSELWQAQMLEQITPLFGRHTPSSFYIYHYVHDYRSKSSNSRHEGGFLESPLIQTYFSSSYATGERVYRAGNVISHNPVVSGLSHCVEYQVAQGNTNHNKLAELCEGYQAPENVLAKLGYLTSRTLYQSDEYSVYEATLPGSNRNPRSRGARVYVLIHNIGADEPIFGLSPYKNDSPIRIYDREFMSKMERASGVQDYLRVNRFVTFHHHVINVKPLWTEYFNIQTPVLSIRIELGNAGELFSGYFRNDMQVPPRTAQAYIASVKTSLKFGEAKTRAKFDETKKAQRIESARRKAASMYGHIFHDRAYWIENTPTDDGGSYLELESFFNGESDYLSDFRMHVHYIQFVNHFSEQCKSSLQPDYMTVSLTTTVRRTQQFVDQVTESKQKIFVDKEMANAYRTYWKNFYEKGEQSESLRIYRDTNMMMRPRSMTSAFFAAHDCSSPEMVQLKTNLTRASQQQPSIQAARISLEGFRAATTFPTTPDSLYEFYRNDGMTLGFANTPKWWLPRTPKQLLASASNKYGPTIKTNGGSILRQSVHVEIDGAAAGSLKSMILSWVSGPGSFSDMILIRDDMHKKRLRGPAAIPEFQQMYVECKYRGGGYYMYWYEKTPEGFTPEELRKGHPEHPFLVIQPPRENCPKEIKTPTSWRGNT